MPPLARRCGGLALALTAGLLLAGCRSLPAVDAELALALREADSPRRLSLLRAEGERITGEPFVGGNRVSLLRDGEGALPALVAAIDGAQSTLDIETYVFDARDGLDLADHLVARAEAGVEVNLLYDAWGSIDTPAALLERLRAAGVHVVEFNPIAARSLFRDLGNHRNHRKLLIADRRVAITGGINISGVYLRRPSPPGVDGDPDRDPDHEHWRDTDIRVEGPAVARYEQGFLESWASQHGPALAPRPALTLPAAGELPVQVISNRPSQSDHDVYRALLAAIALSRHSVHLTTGFFVPTSALRHALRDAAKRGVEVTLIVPSNSTSDYAVDAGRAYYSDLLEDGVAICEYPEDRVLHAKTAVIDGEWVTIGSSNLDWRSVVLNDELNTVILSPAFGDRVEAMFRVDRAHATPVDAARWAQRPFLERAREWRARLFRYLL